MKRANMYNVTLMKKKRKASQEKISNDEILGEKISALLSGSFPNDHEPVWAKPPNSRCRKTQ